MNDDILSNPRLRRLGMAIFLVAASVIAGYGVYEGKMKILGLLALFTAGFLLRLASVRNAYWLTVTALQLSHVRFGLIRDEFELDRWLALAGMAALSLGIVAWNLGRPAWPGIAHGIALALTGFAALSYSWSLDPVNSFAKAGSIGLVMIIVFGGLWSAGSSLARVRELADVHVDMLWIVFPLGVLVYVLPVPGKFYGGRFTSIFENPNALGMWVSVGLPLAVGMALIHPVPWRRRACWVMVATGALVAVLCGSRGGIVGAGIGLGLYAGLRWSRMVVGATAVVATTVGFLVVYGVDIIGRSSTLTALVRPESLEDLSDRRIWWEVGAQIASQRMWFGHGMGVSESLFSVYGVDMSYGTFGATVHNTYLAAWMELGLVGVGLLILAGAWGAWLGYRTWRRDREGELGLLALALTCSAVALMAHAVVEEKLLSAGNPWMLPYWASLAMIARLHRLQREGASSGPDAVARPAPARPGPAPLP